MTSTYIVVISAKKRFRRLHLYGGCPSAYPTGTFEFHEKFMGADYDDFCHRCWSRGGQPDATREAAELLVAAGGVHPVRERSSVQDLEGSDGTESSSSSEDIIVEKDLPAEES